MIELRDVHKTFRARGGTVAALRGVSFAFAPGQIAALLGANGAGKTTALRILSTALRPTSGGGAVAGRDLVREPGEVRRRIGVLASGTGLYGRLTPRELLTYFGRLYGMGSAAIRERVTSLTGRLGLAESIDRVCEGLSAGTRQRVNIARALLHDPPVVVFDEPTTGLDVAARAVVLDTLRDCRAQGRTVLFSTHILSEVRRLCDRAVILHRGGVRFDGTVGDLAARHGEDLEDAFLSAIREPAA